MLSSYDTNKIILFLSQRPRYPAIFPHPPKVNTHKPNRRKGQAYTVEDVESQQGVFADIHRASEVETHIAHFRQDVKGPLSPQNGRGLGHVCPYRYRPECQLIPRKEIPGKTQQEGKHEKYHANTPVVFPGGFIGTRVKHPAHVQDYREYHPVSGPSVHVSQKKPKGNGKLQVFHVLIGILNGGTVIEHKKNAGNSLNNKEKHGYSTKAEGIFYSQSIGSYLYGMEVEETRI